MLESIFNILGALFIDLPKLFFYVLICGAVAYGTSIFLLCLIGLIWESITKKKINDEIESKITRIITICLFIVLFIALIKQG